MSRKPNATGLKYLNLFFRPEEHRALKAASVQSDLYLRDLVRAAALLYVGDGLTADQIERLRAVPKSPPLPPRGGSSPAEEER